MTNPSSHATDDSNKKDFSNNVTGNIESEEKMVSGIEDALPKEHDEKLQNEQSFPESLEGQITTQNTILDTLQHTFQNNPQDSSRSHIANYESNKIRSAGNKFEDHDSENSALHPMNTDEGLEQMNHYDLKTQKEKEKETNQKDEEDIPIYQKEWNVTRPNPHILKSQSSQFSVAVGPQVNNRYCDINSDSGTTDTQATFLQHSPLTATSDFFQRQDTDSPMSESTKDKDCSPCDDIQIDTMSDLSDKKANDGAKKEKPIKESLGIDEKLVSGDDVKPMNNALLINISQIWALSDKIIRLQCRQYKTNICQLLFPVACMITIFILQFVLDFVSDQLTTTAKRSEANVFPTALPLMTSFAMLYNSSLLSSSLPEINPPSRFTFSSDPSLDIGTFNANGTSSGILSDIWKMYLTPSGILSTYIKDNVGNIVPHAEKLSSLEESFSSIYEEIFLSRGELSRIGAFHISNWDVNQMNGLEYDIAFDNITRTQFCKFVARASATQSCIAWMENEMMNLLHQRYIFESTGKQMLLQSKTTQMPYYQSAIDYKLGDLLAYFFFPLILILLLPVFMYHIVKEKETGVREMMYLMSMKTRNYVCVQYIFNYLIYIIVALEFVVLAVLFKFKYVAETSPLLTFLTLSSWGFSLVSSAFFLSAFLHKTSFASVLGYVFVIVSPSAAIVIQQHILCFKTIAGTECPALLKPLLLIFPLPLTHIIYTASTMCLRGNCPSASDITNNMELFWGIFFMFLDGILYLIAGLYFEKILKQPTGVPKHPLFPLQYIWKCTIGRCFRKKHRSGSSIGLKSSIDPHENEDVRRLREQIQNKEITPSSCGVLIDGLVKKYNKNVAVKGVYLQVGHNTIPEEDSQQNKSNTVKEPELNTEIVTDCKHETTISIQAKQKHAGVLGLLGENGAGKTSIIKILVGFQKASGGTAYIAGKSIRNGFEGIYKSLGYCGQFDTSLWDDLTSFETILFYSRLKGVPFLKQRYHTKALLQSVGLWKERNKNVRYLTSGHKRCLSIAISLIGNPSVVILDEPTGSINSVTAMQIWSLIIREKRNRSFIITTHNMEEASAVSDQICIMANGRVKAIGTIDHLKNLFGSGYELSIVLVDSSAAKDCITFIKEMIPTANLVHSFSEHLHFSIPKADVLLSKTFKLMENNKSSLGIKNWSLKATTMEDVFINVVQAAEQEQVEISKKKSHKQTKRNLFFNFFHRKSEETESSDNSPSDSPYDETIASQETK